MAFVLGLVIASLWPVLLLAAVVTAAIAWSNRGPRRALAFVVAVALGIPSLAGGAGALIQARDAAQRETAKARLHTQFQAETVIDGITLPAGMEVTWTDASHTGLYNASMRQPTTILGFSTRYILRDKDEWIVDLVDAREIDGWPCAADRIKLGPEGALRWCTLSRQVEWKGWALPKETKIGLRSTDRGLDLSLPFGAVVFAREIGQPLSWWHTSLNEDGSLDSVGLASDKPFVVRDIPLSDIVRWRYDTATLGEGRARLPVAVEGRTLVAPGGGHPWVVVRLSDGAVTRTP